MKESILIVSNNDKELDVFFTKSDYITYKAEHGLKALRILNNTNISVIIYDLISEETAEFGFLEYIKKKHNSTQVIIISDNNEHRLVVDALKNGAYDYLLKPFNEEHLLRVVTKAISEKREVEHRISSERRNKEYQKVLIKELEITKKELREVKTLLYHRNLELELIYGEDYTKDTKLESFSSNNSPERIGKYTILEEIGRGGMSVVYKAIDHVLNREVAIKELTISEKPFPPSVIDDVTKRFIKEAQVIAMLRQDNIIKVFDVLEEKNKHYMIMEYVEGSTLDQLINNNKKIPVLESVHIVSEVCLALEYIHSNNIIHRDIKPSNIIIDSDRKVKLMDFGVIRDKSVATVTPTGAIVGTMAYTAPEQSSKTADFRIDIFPLGTILYELITGINPFEGDTYADTFRKVSSLEPEFPSKLNDECNEFLDRIVMKALEKNPNKRYESAREFYNSLNHFINQYKSSIA